MKNIALLFALLLVVTAASASPADIFGAYEHARQGLLKQSVADAQAGAKSLSALARREGQPGIAAKADLVASARDLSSARQAFAALSDAMIAYRSTVPGEKPVVAYCSMEKKHWLQPNGAITNPYVNGSMRSCGQVKQ